MHSHDMTRRLFLGSLGATLALPELTVRAQGQTPAAAAANVEKDVVYGNGCVLTWHVLEIDCLQKLSICSCDGAGAATQLASGEKRVLYNFLLLT